MVAAAAVVWLGFCTSGSTMGKDGEGGGSCSKTVCFRTTRFTV